MRGRHARPARFPPGAVARRVLVAILLAWLALTAVRVLYGLVSGGPS